MGKDIELKTMPIQEYTEAPENGILITNPPYGERISADDMDALYASIGERLKTCSVATTHGLSDTNPNISTKSA